MKENEERRTGERRNGRTGEGENGRRGGREKGGTGEGGTGEQGGTRERENETFLNSSNTEGAVNKKWNTPVSFYLVSSSRNFSRWYKVKDFIQYIFQEYVTITF